jgi:hypothetical protein
MLVFGAPGAVLALLVCVAGLLVRQPWLLLAGALGCVPSSFYLGGHPGAGYLWLLPLLPCVAAVALHRQRPLLAALLLVPNAAAAIWLSVFTALNL